MLRQRASPHLSGHGNSDPLLALPAGGIGAILQGQPAPQLVVAAGDRQQVLHAAPATALRPLRVLDPARMAADLGPRRGGQRRRVQPVVLLVPLPDPLGQPAGQAAQAGILHDPFGVDHASQRHVVRWYHSSSNRGAGGTDSGRVTSAARRHTPWGRGPYHGAAWWLGYHSSWNRSACSGNGSSGTSRAYSCSTGTSATGSGWGCGFG
jgi:hypothetical protein